MDERTDWTLTDQLHYDHGRSDPFAAAVRATRMPMIITDPQDSDNPIVFANKAFQDLTGYSRDELMGRNCRMLQGDETDPKTKRHLRHALDQGKDVAVDILNYRKDGTPFWNALYVSPVSDDAGHVRFFFASQVDITDTMDRQARLTREKAEVEAAIARRVAELQVSLEAQRQLLHEVDHRVKNNMAIIASILRLHMRDTQEPQTALAMAAMVDRVDALAAVHRHLYRHDSAPGFDAGSYAMQLARDMIADRFETPFNVHADLQPSTIPAGQASAIGLIVNEILTTLIPSASHSDPCDEVTVRTVDGPDTLTLTVTRPAGLQERRVPTLLTTTLIDRLTRQIDARLSWLSEDERDGAVLTLNKEAE